METYKSQSLFVEYEEDPQLVDPSFIDSIVYEDDLQSRESTSYRFNMISDDFSPQLNFTQDFIDYQITDENLMDKLLKFEVENKDTLNIKNCRLELLQCSLIDGYLSNEININKFLDIKSKVSDTQIPILANENDKNITTKIYPVVENYANNPTSITISKQFIIIGNSLGIIKIFSHDGKDLKQLSPDQQLNAAVTCLEISDDELHIIAGFSSGHIGIWETKSGNCLKAANTGFKNTILSVKFWKKNKLSAIFCDSFGKISLIEFTKLFITTTVNMRSIINGELGICTCIKIMRPNPFFAHPTDAYVVLAVSFIDKVLICTIEPEFKIIYSIEDQHETGSIPYIS